MKLIYCLPNGDKLCRPAGGTLMMFFSAEVDVVLRQSPALPADAGLREAGCNCSPNTTS